MIALEQISSLKDYLKASETVAIIVGPKPTADQLAVASALYQGIASLGKEVGLYAPQKITQPDFATLKDLRTELGKQNLVVEFDYDENAVDKVSYHIGEGSGKFYLTIKPKKGQKPLDTSSVEFSYAGTDADLVFLIGVHDLESLKQLYFGYEKLYANSFVVTIHTFKPELGNIQLDLSGVSSMSESLVALLASLEISLNAEIATDLLQGMEAATNNLQSLTASAETFEVVVSLLRAGARRRAHPSPQSGQISPATDQPVRKSVQQTVEKPVKLKKKKIVIKR